MPDIGEVKLGREVGKGCSNKYIFVECPICKSQRWVNEKYYLYKQCVLKGRCYSCAKGRSIFEKEQGVIVSGYRFILVSKNSEYITMSNKDHYVREHRLIMAKHLGRLLTHSEEVHHINGDKLDNRLENLTVTDRYTHGLLHRRRANALNNMDDLLINLKRRRDKLNMQIKRIEKYTKKYPEEKQLPQLPLFG